MKKSFLCFILIIFSSSLAFAGVTDDFINEVLSIGKPEQARALVTSEKINELINSSDDINVKGKNGECKVEGVNDLAKRSRDILLAGGLAAYTRKGGN